MYLLTSLSTRVVRSNFLSVLKFWGLEFCGKMRQYWQIFITTNLRKTTISPKSLIFLHFTMVYMVLTSHLHAFQELHGISMRFTTHVPWKQCRAWQGSTFGGNADRFGAESEESAFYNSAINNVFSSGIKKCTQKYSTHQFFRLLYLLSLII